MLHAQEVVPVPKTKVYLVTGQGFDQRVFNNIKLTQNFDTVHIIYTDPGKAHKLEDYARLLANQIDTTEKFSLIGVSFGGMICTEMCEFLNPEKVIIISSAKCRKEIPKLYKFFRYFPVNYVLPAFIYKAGGQTLRPIFEKDDAQTNGLFKEMLHDNNPKVLRYSTNMIINWNKKTYSDKIVHIHGEIDHTLLLKNIKANYIIEGGTHLMVYTRADEINPLVNKLLNSE
jgi:pimeloyl-ACP methyl ester carboxylesterase